MPLRIAAHVLGETFAVLRACGQGRRECVAYWLGPAADDHIVDEVVHPLHTAAPWGYQVDDAWLTNFWLDMAARSKSARVQVHTHPGEASHSTMDDGWALIHSPGFRSLVLPRFAIGPESLEDAHLVERTDDGGWRPTSAVTALVICT